jgi:hypothetical protein
LDSTWIGGRSSEVMISAMNSAMKISSKRSATRNATYTAPPSSSSRHA